MNNETSYGRDRALARPVRSAIGVESMIALLALEDLKRPAPRLNESAFPLERRFGRLQLDDQNLYATGFGLQFADSGTTWHFYVPAADV